jgi:hypothetical protein
MIKISDHTDRLHQLIHTEASEDAITAEVDQLFGATVDGISEEDWHRLQVETSIWFREEMIAYCQEHGFDPLIGPNHPVQYLKDFALMVRAKVEGMLPKTPEERAQRRLEAEARRFKEAGDIIRG